MGIGCEVSRVEETNRRAGNVASERLGALRQKEGIVLSKYGQEMWFACPEVILEGWVECDVTPVVAEQIQQNLVGARAGQIGLMSGLCGEELLDENCGVVRVLFREEVATFHRLSLRVRSPLPPNAQRTAVFCIESVERTTLGP